MAGRETYTYRLETKDIRVKNAFAPDWDPDDEKALVRCRKEKRSMLDIAKLLKKTRCAVAGKCHRLGI